jgi:peptidoglycan L-alanyl-D-glutamate endopeptidase CwlK
MDQNSILKLQQLHPKLRAKAIKCYTEAVLATPKDIHPVIEQTYRSFAESDYDYQLGRTIKNPDGADKNHPLGQIVSNAPGGYSWHNYGLALDFHLLVNGKAVWDKNQEGWMTVVNIFKDAGFNWGGEFTGKFKDAPHLEHKMGMGLVELLKMHIANKLIPGTPYVNF